MKKYLVSYSSDGTTANTVIYAVENYEDLFKLIITDFFNYETGFKDEAGVDILESEFALQEYLGSDDFYETCNNRGVYFGEMIELEEALQYVVSAANFN